MAEQSSFYARLNKFGRGELELQLRGILAEFQFCEVVFDWMREVLRQSQKEKAEFQRRSIEKLNAHYAKLQNRIDQIYHKLDGEIEEAFYRRNVLQWREEQNEIHDRGHTFAPSLPDPSSRTAMPDGRLVLRRSLLTISKSYFTMLNDMYIV